MMSGVYSFILKLVLEFAFKKAQDYFSKEADRVLGKAEVVAKVNSLNNAVKVAYDGQRITDDQKRKIVDAARDLIQSYRV